MTSSRSTSSLSFAANRVAGLKPFLSAAPTEIVEKVPTFSGLLFRVSNFASSLGSRLSRQVPVAVAPPRADEYRQRPRRPTDPSVLGGGRAWQQSLSYPSRLVQPSALPKEISG